MNPLLLILLLAQPGQEWPRIAVTQPYADFTGWQSDTAWVIETVIHDLSGEVEETYLIVTEAGCEPSIAYPPGSAEPGTVAATMSTVLDGTADYALEINASYDDLIEMSEACMNFEVYLEIDPPVVPVQMTLIRTLDCTEVWSDSQNLTWFGGECAPIFDLPVLDSAVLSPDSSLLYFCILYGPRLEYHVEQSGF